MENHLHTNQSHYNSTFTNFSETTFYPSSSPTCICELTMSSTQKIGLSRLSRWVGGTFQRFQAKGSKKGKPRRLLSTGVDWIASSFTAMEVSNQLKQVFKLIDANGDEKISPIELGEVLLCLGHEKAAAAKEAEVMVSEVDYNGDGFIDLDEFMEVVGGGSDGVCSKDEDLMDAFLVFDSDKNGYISAKELRDVLISLGHDKCTLQECNLMIKGVDKDGDGQVSFEEFRSMMKGFGCSDQVRELGASN